METKANFVAIGLFTLILIAVGFGFVFWIANFDENRPMKELTIRFPGSVAGLSQGGMVMFNGIDVGEVKRLSYDPVNPKHVIAVLKVDSGIPLKADSNITLSYQGLTGIGYIEMKGGTESLPNVFSQSEPSELMASNSAFEDLMAGARVVLSRADSILSKVETVVDTNEARINNSIENVETFTLALKNNADGIDSFLSDASSAAKGLTSLSAKLETLSTKAEKLIGAVEPESVQKSVKNVETFTDNLAKASNNFDAVIADASSAAKNINEFSGQLSTSLDKVDGLVASIDPVVVRQSVASLSTFAKSLDESSDDISVILDEAKQASTNINSFSQVMSSRSEDFNQIISDARDISARLNTASKKIDGILGKVDGLLDDGEGGKGLIEEATLAARSIRKVAESFESRADQISSGLARFSGRGLREVEGMVGEARQTLRRLESAVGKLEDDPSKLIFGGNKVKTYNRRH
ncbi:MAG: MCE family protein [Cohaesibacter sp.]|jgi:phospholipid/cholesterol/gamma-HCH transport system substrate-binding protein|nr:MCE family protein [Cohaesibacter sp.]